MFAETLKSLRRTYGMTQSDLAKVLGVTLRTLQNYEHGQLPKDEQILIRLSTYFDIPLTSLIDKNDLLRLMRAEARLERKSEDDRTELYRLLQDLTALFAGGSLSESDRALFVEAVTELYNETGPAKDDTPFGPPEECYE